MTLPGAGSARRVPPDVGNLAWSLALAGLSAILLAPLLVVDVPPLVDYPNHLARAFVLASLPGDTILARFYAPHWSIIPNLGLDLIAPALIHVLPVHVAGRLLVAAAVLLPVWGAVSYSTALGGRWWAFGGGLAAYNNCLLSGFLNFSISLGLALLLASGWLRWREDHPSRAITLAAIGAPVLFACHLMGLVFLALLIAGVELFRLIQTRRFHPWRAVLARGRVLLLIFAGPVGLYEFSDLQPLGGDAAFLPWGEKLAQLATVFVNYDFPLDAITAVVAISVPALCLILRWGVVPSPAACAVMLLLIAFLAAPYSWKGTFQLDTRFAVMLGFMLFAGFIPTDWPVWFRCISITALAVLFCLRMVLLTSAWVEHRVDLADLRTVLAPVRPGQAVYVAEAGLNEAPAYWAANPRSRRLANGVRTVDHIGALVLIEHRAYWPFEFDNPSQQPLETLEPYRALAGRVDHMPNRAEAAIANLCGFDYVLLLEADAVPSLPAERFHLLARSGFAALYFITRCEGPS